MSGATLAATAASGAARRGAEDMPAADAQLVTQARRNPGGPAFAELVRRHQGRVRGLLLRLCRDRTTADDLAQEVFVRAFRGIVAFEGRSSFSTWTYRIAYNMFLNHRSRSKPHRSLADGLETKSQVRPDDESPGRSDLRADLAAAVDNLPDHYRAVVVLYYLREVTYPEIADILQLPLGTVKTHLHRARALLRAEMTDWVMAGEGA